MIEVAADRMNLTDVSASEWREIDRLEGPKTECRRLMDLGLTPGERVAVVRSTPMGGPIIVVVRGTQLALRRREASWIQVK